MCTSRRMHPVCFPSYWPYLHCVRSLYRVSAVSRHHIRVTSPYIKKSPGSSLSMRGVFAVRRAIPRDAGGLSPTCGRTDCGIARRWQRVSDAQPPIRDTARHRWRMSTPPAIVRLLSHSHCRIRCNPSSCAPSVFRGSAELLVN